MRTFDDDLLPWEAMHEMTKLERARKMVPHWTPDMKNPSHPAHYPIRKDSEIDLNFKRTREDQIKGLIAFARIANCQNKTFLLKRDFYFAEIALKAARVRFILEDDQIIGVDKIQH